MRYWRKSVTTALAGLLTGPVVGPCLWADGTRPRQSGGLKWERDDFSERDGTHPGESGREKVAQQLLKLFKTDPTARAWFLRVKNLDIGPPIGDISLYRG